MVHSSACHLATSSSASLVHLPPIAEYGTWCCHIKIYVSAPHFLETDDFLVEVTGELSISTGLLWGLKGYIPLLDKPTADQNCLDLQVVVCGLPKGTAFLMAVSSTDLWVLSLTFFNMSADKSTMPLHMGLFHNSNICSLVP